MGNPSKISQGEILLLRTKAPKIVKINQIIDAVSFTIVLETIVKTK